MRFGERIEEADGVGQTEAYLGKSVQAERTARTKVLWLRSTKVKGPGRREGGREKGWREKAGDKTSFIAGSDRKIKVASLMAQMVKNPPIIQEMQETKV